MGLFACAELIISYEVIMYEASQPYRPSIAGSNSQVELFISPKDPGKGNIEPHQEKV